MSDFASEFGKMSELVTGTAKGLMNKIDHMLFNALINNLKSDDFEAVKVAVEQLVKEKRKVSIPPLYFVAHMHPLVSVQQMARKGLTTFGEDKKIAELTQGKDVKAAVEALINEYGNYRE